MRDLSSAVPVLDAVTAAIARGVTCTLRHAVRETAPRLSVTVSTIDLDPTISLFDSRTRRTQLLRDRDQVGPDEWDYPLALPVLSDSLELHMTRGSQSATVALLPWQAASVRTFGWRDLPERTFPAYIDGQDFEQALASLLCATAALTDDV